MRVEKLKIKGKYETVINTSNNAASIVLNQKCI